MAEKKPKKASFGDVPKGMHVDLPFESGSADPQALQYGDLGPEKQFDPKGDFRAAQKKSGGDGQGDGTPAK